MTTGLSRLSQGVFGFLRRRPPAPFAPRTPDRRRTYAVGDIHGHAELLDRLLDLIIEDAAPAFAAGLAVDLVFLGDYIDRGPDSRGVVERLCRGAPAGFSCRFLMGNHEAAMLDFLRDPAETAEWLDYGGVETLASYDVRTSIGIREAARCRAARDRLAENLPNHHRRFLENLELMVEIGDYVFVHAGIKPGRRLDRQRPDDLLWIREPFLSDPRRHEKFVVHGHTMTEEPEIKTNRIGIDTGAYVTGVLTALVLEGEWRCLIQARAR